MLEVSEGRTSNYLVHGISVLFGALIMVIIAFNASMFLIFPAAVLFLLAILLFAATNGLELDQKNSCYRKYGKVGVWKFGVWQKIEEPLSVVLALHSSNEFRGAAPVMGHVVALDTKVITYDVYLIDSLGTSRLIYEFLDYKIAKRALKSISDIYKVPFTDRIAEKLQENKAKRRARR